MDEANKNWRNATVTTGSGTDVKQTSQLKGEAKRNAVEKETNSTTQDYYSRKTSGPFGGENTGS